MRFAIALFFASLTMTTAFAAMTDAQVKRSIIQESIANYPGNCPCPYNIARNGSMCGRRSAYSRPGGYSPICYDSQITQEMVREYRAQHK